MDSYGTINKTTRNDVNMIATVNPNTNKVLLTSIPRDYYVQLHGKTGYKDKLTHAGIYGINTVVQTIEDLFGIGRKSSPKLVKLQETIRSNKGNIQYTIKECNGSN